MAAVIRTIQVNFDPRTGYAAISVGDGKKRLGQVNIQEEGGRWYARGAGSHEVDIYSSPESAFRNTIRALIEEIQEDLLPTKTR